MDRRSLLTGAGLVAASATVTYLLARRRKRSAAGIYVQMGTSITAGYHSPGSYISPFIVGERLNLQPVNVGFDGATAPPFNRGFADDFSLERLVGAIHSRNWSSQDASIAQMDPANKFSLSHLESLAYEEVTHLGMEYGTNDFTVCVPPETFRASLTRSIKVLLSDYPRMRMFGIGPAWNPEAVKPNELGAHLNDYAEMLRQVCHDIGIPYLDMMLRLPLDPANVAVYTFDGKHPNELGARIRGELTAGFIKEVF